MGSEIRNLISMLIRTTTSVLMFFLHGTYHGSLCSGSSRDSCRLIESCGCSLWIHVNATGEYSAIQCLVCFILVPGPLSVERSWSQDQTVGGAACLSSEITCKKRTAKVVALEAAAIHQLSMPRTNLYSRSWVRLNLSTGYLTRRSV